MKVVIIGSKNFQGKQKIKELIFSLKNKFKKELQIITGGSNSTFGYVIKKFALELDCDYKEFNLAGTPRNLYSIMPESYHGKEFHPSHYYHRNKLMVEYCDCMFLFMSENEEIDKRQQSIINSMKKFGKSVIVVKS